MAVYEYKNYKTFLQTLINQSERRGITTAMAKAAACSQSYLSQVLNGKPELTPDQAIAIGDFLKMDRAELEFFLSLVQLSRASTPKLKAHVTKRIHELRQQQLRTGVAVENTSDESLSHRQRDFYYSSWTVSAVHILTACESYQSAEAIAARISLPVRDVEIILQKLIEQKIVTKAGAIYRHSGKNFHLPTESVHNQLNHLNWRIKSLESTNDASSIHYTSAFAISREHWDGFKANLLAFIDRQRKDIGRSGSEEAYVFCCDLFKM